MKLPIKYTFTAPKLEFGLLAVLWGLPLLYIFGSQQLSVTARWTVLITLLTIVLTSPELRSGAVRELRLLRKEARVLLGILAVAIIASTFTSSESWAVRLIGWGGESLGLFTWLSFIALAITLRSHVRTFITSYSCLILGGFVCLFSLLNDHQLIAHGFRVSGLLIVATSTAIYAALTLGIALWQLVFAKQYHRTAILVGIVAMTTLLLCQSRAAQCAAVITSLLYAIYAARQRQKDWHLFAPLVMAVILVIIPLFGGSYFMRMRGEQVDVGLSYRADIYRTSLHEITHQNPLLGLGPSGVPQEINSRATAPPGIVESLNQNYVFLSAHDVFLDAALCFGLVGGLALLALVLMAGAQLLVVELNPETLLFMGFFLGLLINGLLNVPSIELTSWLFMALLTALPSHKGVARRKVKAA